MGVKELVLGLTHRKPIVNTSTTPSLRFLLTCRVQTALTGTSKMMKSVIVLKKPLVVNKLETSMQVPRIALFQILALGVHSHILANDVAA